MLVQYFPEKQSTAESIQLEIFVELKTSRLKFETIWLRRYGLKVMKIKMEKLPVQANSTIDPAELIVQEWVQRLPLVDKINWVCGEIP